MGFEQVHDDLREMDFRVAAGLFTSEEVGAIHRRERLFIMANTQRIGWNGLYERSLSQCMASDIIGGSENVSYRTATRNQCGRISGIGKESSDNQISSSWWGDEPTVDRLVDGVASGMDRNRACGNGVVPLAASYAWRVLEDCLQMGGIC